VSPGECVIIRSVRTVLPQVSTIGSVAEVAAVANPNISMAPSMRAVSVTEAIVTRGVVEASV
jgi:hypothetical protein